MRSVVAAMLVLAVSPPVEAEETEQQMLFASPRGLLIAMRDGLTEEEADNALYFMTTSREGVLGDRGLVRARDYFKGGAAEAQQRLQGMLERAENEGRVVYHHAGSWRQLNEFLRGKGLRPVRSRFAGPIAGYGGMIFLDTLGRALQARRSLPRVRLVENAGDLGRFRKIK